MGVQWRKRMRTPVGKCTQIHDLLICNPPKLVGTHTWYSCNSVSYVWYSVIFQSFDSDLSKWVGHNNNWYLWLGNLDKPGEDSGIETIAFFPVLGGFHRFGRPNCLAFQSQSLQKDSPFFQLFEFLNSWSRKIAENSVRVALGKLRLRDCKQNIPLCLPTKIQNKNWQKFDFENFGHVEASSKCDFLTVSSLFIPEITRKTIGEIATKFEESEVFSQSAQKSKFSAEFSSSRCLFSAIYCASSTLHIQ